MLFRNVMEGSFLSTIIFEKIWGFLPLKSDLQVLLEFPVADPEFQLHRLILSGVFFNSHIMRHGFT